MDRSTVLRLLNERRDDLRERFGARHLAVFGSAARDELHGESDVEVLVEFDGPTTFEAYLGLKNHLQQLFERPVDLVTDKGLKPRAREHVEKDLIRVA